MTKYDERLIDFYNYCRVKLTEKGYSVSFFEDNKKGGSGETFVIVSINLRVLFNDRYVQKEVLKQAIQQQHNIENVQREKTLRFFNQPEILTSTDIDMKANFVELPGGVFEYAYSKGIVVQTVFYYGITSLLSIGFAIPPKK